MSAVLAISAAILATTGIGLWRMKKWSVVLFMILGVLGFINALVRRFPLILGGNVVEAFIDLGVPLCVVASWLFIARQLWKAVQNER